MFLIKNIQLDFQDHHQPQRPQQPREPQPQKPPNGALHTPTAPKGPIEVQKPTNQSLLN